MVLITEELVRKKSEHNEGIISSLEELSLHQEDVEKIEHLNNWCRDLQILYLQANLIAKIENLNKLKKLQYLNLALNNIEKVENLERCESLQKLDLTLNFIGDLQSVCSLKHNLHLTELYLTGNPCCEFPGYRNYVIVNLPNLESLDNEQVMKSEQIKARQTYAETERKVFEAQEKYLFFREQQRERLKNYGWGMEDDEFWNSASEHSPEVRVEIARRHRKNRGLDDEKDKDDGNKRMVKLFNKQGRPMNINQAKLKFEFNENDPKEFVLDIAIYKYLDTNLIDVDVQPIFVTVYIKGKVFQFVLPEEVCTDKSVAQRSQTTGHLVIRMPRMNYRPKEIKRLEGEFFDDQENECKKHDESKGSEEKSTSSNKREYLDIDDLKNNRNNEMDFSKIVENAKSGSVKKDGYPEVPPLQYGF